MKKDRRLVKTSTSELLQSINLAKTHAGDIQDAQGVEVYLKIPPGPRSTHGLTTYLSLRPESKLENNHDGYKHYANTGMRPELADILTLRGMVEKMWLSVGDWHWPRQWLKRGGHSSIFLLISVKLLHT